MKYASTALQAKARTSLTAGSPDLLRALARRTVLYRFKCGGEDGMYAKLPFSRQTGYGPEASYAEGSLESRKEATAGHGVSIAMATV